ncbi:hypothetical protein [Rhizobium sp. GN54]|uniref:hypothetical protein n=1 Tax=Rhizobium sp. GN54 TaxID=2898150 RepID=UPI001E44942D|nr:hypothetical protein [Rhizobium sp. GN54]MCD2184739.1 hypothetical protein [Rhizobium sp. GN54]
MNLKVTIPAAIALAVSIYTPSLADCVDITGSVSQEARRGIAKDGTHAPMEGASGSQVETKSATGTTTTSSDALPNTAQKHGNAMPMGESTDLATSGQDVIAQQKGERTAAAEAQDKCK